MINIKPLAPHWQRIVLSNSDRFRSINHKFNIAPEASLLFPLVDWYGEISGFYLRSIVTKGRYCHSLGPMPLALSRKPNPGVLLLVEGIADLLSIEDCSPFTAAMMTNGLNSYQQDWIYLLYKKGFITRVVLIRDNDERSDNRNPGLVGAISISKGLNKLGVPFVHYATPYGFKDPGDMYGDPRIKDFARSITVSLGEI